MTRVSEETLRFTSCYLGNSTYKTCTAVLISFRLVAIFLSLVLWLRSRRMLIGFTNWGNSCQWAEHQTDLLHMNRRKSLKMKQLRCLEGDSETPSVTKKDSPENNRWIRYMNKKLKLEKLIGCLCFLNMFLMAAEFVKTEGNRRKFVSLSVKISHKVIILPSSHSNHPSDCTVVASYSATRQCKIALEATKMQLQVN